MRRAVTFTVMLVLLFSVAIPGAPSAAANYNYGEALQKALIFYDFQRSGKLPEDKRDNWRGDSGLTDGADVGLDLTGGWYDAGDHVKFNLPMSYTANMLAWSVYENRDGYAKSGQLGYVLDDIKWACDYFIKCHTGPTEYYFQVGDGIADHNWWGPAEVMDMKRPAYKVTASNPGATVTAETAAALAAAAVVFKDTDPEYAAKCLQHAKSLYTFADAYQSDAGYGPAENYYRSASKWYDELSWACVWLYLATNDSSYIDKAESYVPSWTKEIGTQLTGYRWAHCWDDVHYGAELMLARITGKSTYKEMIERNLDYWTTGYGTERIKYSPKGLAFCDTWGSLRYATTTAFLADVYADWSGCTASKVNTYKTFAKSQVDYALGSTGRSFVVGFGTNPPQHPHHRTAHSSYLNSMDEPPYHRHTLFGALVGGPDASDTYTDDINSYTTNEVACDYNAGFTAALSRMYNQYGGTPIANFNAIEKPGLEVYVGGAATISDSKTSLKVFLYNKSAWPARSYDKLSFRYFMDLSELYAAGHTASEVKITIDYSPGGKAAGIFPYDEAKHIYYAVIDFSGTQIVPGGATTYKKEAQVNFEGPAGVKWDSANDFSYKGFANGTEDNPNISVYNNGVRIYGAEPGSPSPSVSPVPTSTPFPTAVPVDKGSISGYVSPDFLSPIDAPNALKSGFRVEVEGTELYAVTDNKGYFLVSNIPTTPGTYSIKISKAGYLTTRVTNLNVALSHYIIGSNSSPALMWAGDITANGTQDGAINMTDIMEAAKAFNTTSAGSAYNVDCDLNNDGAINMNDIMIIARHFNKTSGDCPKPEVTAVTP